MTRLQTALLALALLAGAAIAQFKPAKSAAEVKSRLATVVNFPGIDDPRIPVADVLNLLQKKYALKIELREAAFVKAGLMKPGQVEVRSLPAMNASLDRVLRKVIANLKVGATFAVVGGTVQISTEPDLRSRRILPAAPPVLKKRQATAAAKLKSVVDFPGVDDPRATLAELLQLIKARYKVEVHLREEAFEAYDIRDVGRTALAKPIPKMKATLAKVIEAALANIKVPDDRPVAIIGSDGTIVITTQKAGEKPITPAGGAAGL